MVKQGPNTHTHAYTHLGLRSVSSWVTRSERLKFEFVLETMQVEQINIIEATLQYVSGGLLNN
jgi:hypothetical protein